MSQQQRYEYTPIEEDGIIRLIDLEPSDDIEAPVIGTIVVKFLADCDYDLVSSYTALSYVWGDAEDTKDITVDGRILTITTSLEVALRHLRDRTRGSYIWADGVCVNQSSAIDRNRQVRQMGHIYSVAKHTIVFLGRAFPGTDKLLTMFKEYKPVKRGFKNHIHHEATAFIPILQQIVANTWFTRVWVFQEVVLSKDPWIQLGRTRLRWDTFIDTILTIWEYDLNALSPAIAAINTNRDPVQRTDIRLPNEPFLTREPFLGHVLGTRDFIHVLEQRRGLGVTIPSDCVYGHVGLAHPTIRRRLKVDYEKPFEHVLGDVAHLALSTEDDLIGFLKYIELLSSEDRPAMCPSWVPNASRPLVDGIDY